ncbi:MAG TPA: nitroreductase [Burkholderiaceae bacterium]|nr:nitroreductase [Burkholderiaceae bacterium]
MSSAAIDSLLGRRSMKFVQAPGPSETELDTILQAAMRAPDHGQLRPWRFRLMRGDAVAKWAETAIRICEEAGEPITPQKAAGARQWLKNVPILLAVGCYIDHSNTRIPEEERMLATGAAVVNMLNAAHMLGYSAYWSTGLGTYVDEVAEALDFDPLEYRFMGYVSFGTAMRELPTRERPDYHDFVTEWTGE